MKRLLISFQGFLERYRLLPSFGECTIFLMAVSLGVILLVDETARGLALELVSRPRKATIIVALGIFFACYTAFFSYFINEIQKFYMFWFAVLVNLVSAIVVIRSLSGTEAPIFAYIIPVFTVVIAIIMIILWHADLLDTSSVPHKSVSYSHIVYGIVVIGGTVLLLKYVFHWAWPDIFLTSVAYTTLFNEKIAGYLPGQNDPNYYTEHDVHPLQSGTSRGSERFVTGKNGEVYYTDTHYGNQPGTPFQQLK